jgi:hypothetical protein
VHPDQQTLLLKLKSIKKSMSKIKLLYQGQDITLWDFAALAAEAEITGNVLFEEKMRKGKMGHLTDALADCEAFVMKIFEKVGWKQKLKNLIGLKIFGSLE